LSEGPQTATPTVDKTESNSVWSKDEIERQIRRLEHKLDVAQKRLTRHGDKTKEEVEKQLEEAKIDQQKLIGPSTDQAKLKAAIAKLSKEMAEERQFAKAKEVAKQLELVIDSFSQNKWKTAGLLLIEAKQNLRRLINSLNRRGKLAYFVSMWAFIPISYAILGLSLSFYLLITSPSSIVIMGVVPLWASLVAAMGASVQILVGVVKDYKDDGLITSYKSLWYIVVIPASLAFGFVAFLLIQAGLLTVSQGTFIINPANQTVASVITNQTATGGAVSQTQISITYGLALPLILCFLAGYTTDWFMGLLGKLTSTSESGKSNHNSYCSTNYCSTK
jgi:hypothetical protein